MHISTSAIYVILLSCLGGSKTAHAVLHQDAFGVTNYGILCQDRVYPKYSIYAAAKNYCDIKNKIPEFPDQDSAVLGFQTRFYYYFHSKTDINNMLKTSHHIVPILENGKLYPLESSLRKDSTGEMGKKDPGPDRLVMDEKCNIVGAFTDFNYTPDRIENKIEECKVLKSLSDVFLPRNHSPKGSPQRSSSRSRDQSPARSQQIYPPSSREQSPERHPESSPGRTIEQSSEIIPDLFRQRTRHHSAEMLPEISSEKF